MEGLQIDLAVRLSAEADPLRPKPAGDADGAAEPTAAHDTVHAAADLILALKHEARAIHALTPLAIAD